MLSTLALLAVVASVADTVDLTMGMVITHSVVIRPAPYRLPASVRDSVVIRIKGDDIDVDFAGASLIGAPYSAASDQAAGIGILVDGGRNITLRGATIRGYRVGILARGVTNLRLTGNDVSYNWRPRLWSGIGHESLADWLSWHHNDADEWLRYGAAIYLAGVQGGEIRGNTGRYGMNGLLLARSSKLAIWNNDFSFLSGVGIGLYRSSDNRIVANRADYCVRGFRHGVYNRGQDSAALLLYEQSARNLVAYNSLTHGGDGLFLWAGQSTMDSGQGGANDNVFFGNDFSFAVTNGIEATFSRNQFIGNLVEGAHHGLWGGYSYGSVVRGNRFRNNVIGIAIEHGQDNQILGNDFEGDTTAIRLWGDKIEPSDWGYPRHRDTKSRSYRITGNRFLKNRLALSLADTRQAVLLRNTYFGVDSLYRLVGDTAGFRRDARKSGQAASALNPWRPNRRDPAAPPLPPKTIDQFASPPPRRGRATILVDEWGPYDWMTPRAWPVRNADSAVVAGPIGYQIVGPNGEWRVVGVKGATTDRKAGKVGDTVMVTPNAGKAVDVEVEFEHTGDRVVTPDGALTRAGDPYRFTLRRFAALLDWRVEVFPWDSPSDPRSAGDGFRTALARAPVLARRDSLLDYLWSSPRFAGVPAERFLATASTGVELPKNGLYDLVTISDDGIRVWVDDKLVIDHWSAHESAVDRAELKSGKHRIRVEYYQVDGWVELRAEIRLR